MIRSILGFVGLILLPVTVSGYDPCEEYIDCKSTIDTLYTDAQHWKLRLQGRQEELKEAETELKRAKKRLSIVKNHSLLCVVDEYEARVESSGDLVITKRPDSSGCGEFNASNTVCKSWGPSCASEGQSISIPPEKLVKLFNCLFEEIR